MGTTAAELVYGEPLKLPEQFLVTDIADGNEDTTNFIKGLRQQIRRIKPIDGSHHRERSRFVFKDLAMSPFVFVRHDGPKSGLQNPYNGSFKVLSRIPKHFVIKMNEKELRVTIDRVKPTSSPKTMETTRH